MRNKLPSQRSLLGGAKTERITDPISKGTVGVFIQNCERGGDQGRRLPNMGRVSPGDGGGPTSPGCGSGMGQPGAGCVFWCPPPALLIFFPGVLYVAIYQVGSTQLFSVGSLGSWKNDDWSPNRVKSLLLAILLQCLMKVVRYLLHFVRFDYELVLLCVSFIV